MKIVFVTSHLSTGGLPQFLLKKIEMLKDQFDLYVIEWQNIADAYVVHKNKIKSIIGNHFTTLPENKEKILDVLEKINPDVIHFEEFPETFVDEDILKKIYSNKKYFICETTHGTTFRNEEKWVKPDKTLFVSSNNLQDYIKLTHDFDLIEYPIVDNSLKLHMLKELKLDPNKFHVLNVGLFTPGKNQGEIFEYARKLINEKVEFHFVGNQADNFKDYWEPLMKQKPKNCRVWLERDDVFRFYSCCDLFLFTSKLENKPLVINEALHYNIPVMMYWLENYGNSYTDNKNITFLTNNFDENLRLIKNKMGLKDDEPKINPIPEKSNSCSNKIKAYHLLTNIFEEREKRSIQCLSKLPRYGIDYKMIINNPYTDLPPKETCAFPEIVGLTPGHTLTPAHYGCYLAHKQGALEGIKENVDNVLIFEADCLLDIPTPDFVSIVHESIDLTNEKDLVIFSFGYHHDRDIIEKHDKYYVAKNFIGAHAYLIPRKSFGIVKNIYDTQPWNVGDLFLANNLKQYRIGIYPTAITKQAAGTSLLEKVYSDDRF